MISKDNLNDDLNPIISNNDFNLHSVWFLTQAPQHLFLRVDSNSLVHSNVPLRLFKP